MNKQNLIKEYIEFGFTAENIAEELNIDIALVNYAIEEREKAFTERKALTARGKGHWASPKDIEKEHYEILYKFGPAELNKNYRQFGLKPGSRFMGITWERFYALKIHFGYHNPLPMDALERITYFSTELRRAVDERDNRSCIRCGEECTIDSIRYHKISHPGPMIIDNCATLCHYCRFKRISPLIQDDFAIFADMGIEAFKEWIDTYVPSNPNRKDNHYLNVRKRQQCS